MAKKFRINVVCSSRNKRFMVLAEGEWTLKVVKDCAEDVFHRLYSQEPQLRLSGLQNEFHFDMPLTYTVEDTIVDTGLVFGVEQEQSLWQSIRMSSETTARNKCDLDYVKVTLSKKKKTARSKQSHTSQANRTAVSLSSDRVSSTTSPTLTAEGANLTPQIVEKISEDSEVDIESIDDGPMQSAHDMHNCSLKRKKTLTKTRKQIKKPCLVALNKARKIKRKTKSLPPRTALLGRKKASN